MPFDILLDLLANGTDGLSDANNLTLADLIGTAEDDED